MTGAPSDVHSPCSPQFFGPKIGTETGTDRYSGVRTEREKDWKDRGRHFYPQPLPVTVISVRFQNRTRWSSVVILGRGRRLRVPLDVP